MLAVLSLNGNVRLRTKMDQHRVVIHANKVMEIIGRYCKNGFIVKKATIGSPFLLIQWEQWN